MFTSFREFQHENLVKLYGVCTKQGPVFIVQELMINGMDFDLILLAVRSDLAIINTMSSLVFLFI